MSIAARPPSRTFADVLERLGRVPPDRIRMQPPPGTATEGDILEIAAREKRMCELIDGVLVEKPIGYGESILAVYIARMLDEFVEARNLGHVTGEQGMMRLFPGLVRIPDVAFASWGRFPNGRWDGEAIPDLAPDLAVEVLSESNTPEEISIKIDEYFAAGVRLVWIVDPHSRSAQVFRSPEDATMLGEVELLDGGDVLPGFTLSLAKLFGRWDRQS